MELVNLKIEDKEKKDDECCAMDERTYPYGLCIRLDKETLDKLGIKDLSIKQTVMITAKAYVSEVSAHESENYSSNNIELQITDMAVSKEREKDHAESMYGSAE